MSQTVDSLNSNIYITAARFIFCSTKSDKSAKKKTRVSKRCDYSLCEELCALTRQKTQVRSSGPTTAMEDWVHQGDAGGVPRVTESPKPEPAFRKRFTESFRLNPSALRRHSRAQSICSSVSSAHFFDSDTAYSASTVASPISTVYESEADDFICPPFLDRPSSRVAERQRQHFASFDSGSTWVGDREEEEKMMQERLQKPKKSALSQAVSPKTFLKENSEDESDLKR